jgi:toxin HigB-1
MRYTYNMIINFKSKETKKIWEGEVSLRLPRDIQNIARRKLRMLNNARKLNDLRVPPNNRLEALKGDRVGEHSIRINDQWRICFKWIDSNATDVIIEDYH